MMIHLPDFRENFYIDVDKVVAIYPVRQIGEETFREIQITTLAEPEISVFESQKEMMIAFEKVKNQIMKAKNNEL